MGHHWYALLHPIKVNSSPTCKKSASSRCVKQGHLIQCRRHSDKYYMPGSQCVSCVNEAAAAERAKEEKEKKEKKKKEKKEEEGTPSILAFSHANLRMIILLFSWRLAFWNVL